MKKKSVTVRFEVEDEHPMRIAGTKGNIISPIGARGFEEYLREIVEIPQHPDTEPDEGYYVTDVEVVSIEEQAT